MTKEVLLATVFKNETDCVVVNFFKDTLTLFRKDKETVIKFTTEELGNFMHKIIESIPNKWALDMRAADLGGIIVLGRSIGFNKTVQKMGVANQIKPMSML